MQSLVCSIFTLTVLIGQLVAIKNSYFVTSNVRFLNLFPKKMTITLVNQTDNYGNLTFALDKDEFKASVSVKAFATAYSSYVTEGLATLEDGSATQFTLTYNYVDFNGSDVAVVFPLDTASTIFSVLKQPVIERPPNIQTKSPFDKNFVFGYTPLPFDDSLVYSFYLKSDNCHQCEYQRLNPSSSNYFIDNNIGSKSLKIVSSHPDKSSPVIVELDSLTFESRGIYHIFYVGATQQFKVVTLIEPESYYMPVFLVGVFLVLVVIVRLVYSRYTDKIEADEYYSVKKNIRNPSNTSEYVVEERILEADIMRGLFIVLFIVVNCGGGGYIMFNESVWDGFTFGDTPELGIAWVAGFCIPIMVKYKGKTFKSNSSFAKFILAKCCILIGAGFSYNGNFDLTRFIYTGLFQRLGIALAINTILVIYIPFVHFDAERAKPQIKRIVLRSLIMLLLPIVNVILTLKLNVPGCPTGYLRPGGIEANGAFENCTGGAHRYLDLLIFGEDRLRNNPTCKSIYNCANFDKYGILGTLNFIFGMYLGVLIGEGFIKFKDRRRRMIYTVSSCVLYLLLIILSIICMDQYFIIPINRSLYSLAFVCCGTLLVQSLLVVLTYLRPWLRYTGWPFVQIGLNGAAILFMQEVCKDILPFGFLNDGNRRDLVICSLMNITIWTSFALALNKYKFYIKI